MHIHSTSKYQLGTVNSLVTFATEEVDTDGVVFNVKNSKRAYAGRAYYGIPPISPFSRDPQHKYLVVLRLGDPSHFPIDNMVTRTRWKVITEDEYYDTQCRTSKTYKRDGSVVYTRAQTVTHPYGGMTSPFIVLKNWQEGLVYLASHEARHIHQFKNDLPRSEVDCEKFAHDTLMRYRAETERSPLL